MIKEIQKIKIALTSNCTLRCTHCRINKEKVIDIKLSDCIRAIDLILKSSGDYKRIELYGGEPFTRFDLLKKIVDYIKLKKCNKKVSINIATNATIINDEIIKWIKDNSVIIAISFSGSNFSHSYNRRFKSGESSYEIVKKNIKKIIDAIGDDRVVCIYCIDPGFAKNIVDDFKKIVRLGVRIFDIECVSGVKWTNENYKDLIRGVFSINKYMLEEIKSGIYIFRELFIEYERYKNFNFPICPAYRDLEVYPDGGVGFYPYGFIDYKRYKRHIVIGNMANGFKKRYLNCIYPSKLCDTCIRDYYILDGLYEGSIAYKIVDTMSQNFYKSLRASKHKVFVKRYFKKLRELKKVFYEE